MMDVIRTIPLSWSEAANALIDELSRAGFQVFRSFDLQAAREALVDPESCPCPYHGTAKCTCQYMVLLVSRAGRSPVSVVIHGHDLTTRISLSRLGEAGESDGQIAEIEAVITAFETVAAQK